MVWTNLYCLVHLFVKCPDNVKTANTDGTQNLSFGLPEKLATRFQSQDTL